MIIPIVVSTPQAQFDLSQTAVSKLCLQTPQGLIQAKEHSQQVLSPGSPCSGAGRPMEEEAIGYQLVSKPENSFRNCFLAHFNVLI